MAWVWAASLFPASFGVADLGYTDLGGGPVPQAGHHHGTADGVSVTALTADPDRPADVTVDLVARQETFRLASGDVVKGYTLNGTSPGPEIRARRGELVEVRVVNESVADGMTLHWHGLDLPNGSDGVAGVTQDAVRVGEEYRYRFVAEQVGTFWYHSHQLSHEQVKRGLLGALVITEPDQAVEGTHRERDVVALVHRYGSTRTVNGREHDSREIGPGVPVRVRVINTDDAAMHVWVAGGPFRLLAVDGTDLVEPGPVDDEYVWLTAGGRADLEVVTPEDGSPVAVRMGPQTTLVLGPRGAQAPPERTPHARLDLLSYGSPAPIGPAADTPDRAFTYTIGRRFGLLDGKPGLWWTVNGRLFPNVPMYTVAEGDVVRMTITNRSGQPHPMHLHGHHVVVLSRDGEPATGSPWWVDSLHVGNDESYEIAFVADNPGIWMDHCHNLPHATEGLVAHLVYEGVTTPFTLGGAAGNEPE